MDSSLVAPIASASAAVLTSIVTVFATLGTTGRRLRSTLSHDVELLERLRGTAARDLRADVQRRAHLLVAQSRYPQVVLYDALMVVVALIATSLQIYVAYEIRNTPAGGIPPEGYDSWVPAANFFFAALAFAGLTKSWTTRGALRLRYIFSSLGDEEAKQKAKVLAFPLVALPMLASAIVVLVGWKTYVEPTQELVLHPVMRAIGSIGAVVLAPLAILIVAARSSKPLNRIVRFYAPVPLVHQERDFNFRPKELGGDPNADFARLAAEIRSANSKASSAALLRKKRRGRRIKGRND